MRSSERAVRNETRPGNLFILHSALRTPKLKYQGDHGRCRADYRCCLAALAGFVSPQSMGPGNRKCAAAPAQLQGETFKYRLAAGVGGIFLLSMRIRDATLRDLPAIVAIFNSTV